MCAKPVRVAALLTTVLLSPLAFAGEVVEFTDGRYLEVESHQVIDDAMRLNVSGSSYLVFPLSQVDRIERGGREVFRQPGTVTARGTESERRAVLLTGLRGDAAERAPAADLVAERSRSR